jgi:hypothetical protein
MDHDAFHRWCRRVIALFEALRLREGVSKPRIGIVGDGFHWILRHG